MKNCRFHNNTSDSLFAARGNAGGISISYNLNVTKAIAPVDTLTSLITNCRFTDNSARLFNGQGGTSADVLMYNIYPGRGGAVTVIVSTDIKLTFNFSDNKIMNNFAEVYGGGVYWIIRGSSSQAHTFNNNVFENNTALRAGGLAIFYVTVPTVAIHTDIYNCTFYNNTASQKAGAVIISTAFVPATNIFVTLKGCEFLNNIAVIHSGAVETALYYDVRAESLITFINWLVKL